MAENIIKDFPEVGDIVVVIDGKKKFIRGAEATKEFVDTLQAVGVVYDVQGNLVRVVGGSNATVKQWSCVADFEITAIPSASQSCEVKLLNAVVGNFPYNRVEGTIEEFATQLNTWLASNAPKWEAYTRDGHSYLQMHKYDAYENTCTIAGATLVKLIGSEVASYTISTGARNAVKQYTTYNGMCYARLLDRARTATDANYNPTTRMDGTTQLFVTFPCSEAYYNGALGDGLREHFPTYEEYIRACMCEPRDLDKGVMKFKDGKLMTSLLKDKTVLKQGVETFAYPAARFAHEYDAGVDGFRAGDWWLPSMYELALLMRDITNNTTAPLDKISTALTKKTDWSAINTQSTRWSSSRYSTNNAWYYTSNGLTYNSYFYYSFSCSLVTAFKL